MIGFDIFDFLGERVEKLHCLFGRIEEKIQLGDTLADQYTLLGQQLSEFICWQDKLATRVPKFQCYFFYDEWLFPLKRPTGSPRGPTQRYNPAQNFRPFGPFAYRFSDRFAILSNADFRYIPAPARPIGAACSKGQIR